MDRRRGLSTEGSLAWISLILLLFAIFQPDFSVVVSVDLGNQIRYAVSGEKKATFIKTASRLLYCSFFFFSQSTVAHWI